MIDVSVPHLGSAEAVAVGVTGPTRPGASGSGDTGRAGAVVSGQPLCTVARLGEANVGHAISQIGTLAARRSHPAAPASNRPLIPMS